MPANYAEEQVDMQLGWLARRSHVVG